MTGYRIISFIQGIVSLFLALSLLDAEGLITMNAAFGLSKVSDAVMSWWSIFAFWAYLIALIALLQIVKAFIVKERD